MTDIFEEKPETRYEETTRMSGFYYYRVDEMDAWLEKLQKEWHERDIFVERYVEQLKKLEKIRDIIYSDLGSLALLNYIEDILTEDQKPLNSSGDM